MKTTLITLLFCLVSITLLAQTSGNYRVKGLVLDSLSKDPVEYATIGITYKAVPDKKVKMLVTDPKGKFQETLPGEGEYTITISSVGNRPIVHDFEVNAAAKEADLGILYSQEEVEELGGVTVLAQKPLVKVDIDKIAYDVASDPDAEAKTVLDMLRKVPLITVDGEDNIKLNGKSDFKIHLNGRPSNLLSNNPGKTLKSMPANAIKEIEVITSPGAKYDAEGVGGIINIVTQSGKGLEGYTATFSAGASNQGGWNAGVNAMIKIGKLSVSGNYNHSFYRMADLRSGIAVEYFNDKTNHFLNMSSRSAYLQPMNYGSAEASYEIDSLNLLTFTIGSYGGNIKYTPLSYSEMLDENGEVNYRYQMTGKDRQKFGGTELSLNYQRTLGKKDELLTTSYRYSHNPSSGTSYQHITPLEGAVPIDYSEQNSHSDATTNEHTVQLDYINPFNQMHSLEAGLKFINRNNSSESSYERKAQESDPWTPYHTDMPHFDHNQYILSAYTAYSLKYKFFGLKLGTRLEQSKLKVKLYSDNTPNFDATFTDVVPTTNLSFKLSDTKTLRTSYNMRISRPGIWYLNPYRDESNPHFISYGNPDLESEKFHNMNLNFSSFTQKLMVNASISYDLCNNSIQKYSHLNEGTGIVESTYGNIGKRQSVGLGLYVNATVFQGTNLWMNGMVNYKDIKSNDPQRVDASAKGWQWGGSLGLQQTLPWKIQLSAYGGYYSADIQLQSKGFDYYYYGLSLSRSFLKEERLTISFSAQNFLSKFMNYKSSSYTKDFYQWNNQKNEQRNFYLSVSYRLGSLKTVVKKVARGIVNDDIKSSGAGGASGQQGGK